jgi:uncharacterized membrane protein YdjX (TVP38/TMEM64 family)
MVSILAYLQKTRAALKRARENDNLTHAVIFILLLLLLSLVFIPARLLTH